VEVTQGSPMMCAATVNWTLFTEYLLLRNMLMLNGTIR